MRTGLRGGDSPTCSRLPGRRTEHCTRDRLGHCSPPPPGRRARGLRGMSVACGGWHSTLPSASCFQSAIVPSSPMALRADLATCLRWPGRWLLPCGPRAWPASLALVLDGSEVMLWGGRTGCRGGRWPSAELTQSSRQHQCHRGHLGCTRRRSPASPTRRDWP